MSSLQSQVPKLLFLFVVYVLTAWLGLSLYPVNGFASYVWMPSGVAVAALFLYGIRLWPAILLGAFFSNLMSGAVPPVALGIAVGNTLEAVIGAYLLINHVHLDYLLARLRDTLGLIATALGVTLISASIGAGSLWLGSMLPAVNIGSTWLAWWIGDTLGVLILTPFLIRWFTRIFFRKTKRELAEGTVLFLTLIFVSIFIFWIPVVGSGAFPMFYLLFPPLVWAALRAGPRGVTLAIVLVSVISIAAAITQHGAFRGIDPQEALLSLQLFIGFIIVLFLPFTAIVEDSKNVLLSLEEKNEQLSQALARLAEEDKAKNEFLAILAHELRNPLSPVISSLELIKIEAHEGKPAALNLIETAETHIRTLTHLLDDLLDISRITRKQFKLRRETIELQAVIQHSLQTVGEFYKSKNHTLTVSLPEKPVWIKADPLRFQQVIVNLLHNAAKYTEPGGAVNLTATYKKEMLRIVVKDTGIGIEPHMLSVIFEPFLQGQSDAHAYSGMGIGLALTKRLVELHDGEVWAESDGPGKGSRFIIELPVPSAVQLPLQSAPRYVRMGFPLVRKAASSFRVLIVDDNEAAAKGLSALLSRIGHTTATANSGPSAIEWLRANPADIILLDIGMPGMDGYATAAQMQHEFGAKTPVLIALTGYGQDEDKRKAKEAGFDFHLTKPVSIDEVERTFAQVTARPGS
jgi:signal transduction histidine kinase/ActR/RegA family two-component response regulator